MKNLDYIKEIKETEQRAEEIIASSRALRQQGEKKALAEAEEIIAKAENEGNLIFKTVIKEAGDKSENILSEAKNDAQAQALTIKEKAMQSFDEAVNNVVKGIVDICVNS